MSSTSIDQTGMKEYVLSKSVVTDGDSVRSLALNTTSDSTTILLSGAEGGMLSTTNLSSYDTSILSSGSTRHPHTITAILAIQGDTDKTATNSGDASYVTACKDTIIRIFSNTNDLILSLEGHEKAVTSLSWLPVLNRDPILVSGSWDGTAKLWNIKTGMCLATLPGHENTVTVQGLPPGINSNGDCICNLATGSAGIANGNNIRDHKIRLWSITVSSDYSHVKTELKTTVANDHGGPIRGLCYDTHCQMLMSCSNDGTVKVREVTSGECITTLAFNDQPMLLDVQALSNGWVVSGAEDGNVIVWNVEAGSSFQVIPHPNSVWAVLPLPNGEFCTACHDGCIRFFTTDESKYASPEEISSFTDAVQEARARASTGPSADEIAKLPRWEENASHVGKSEGQVQVFQKNGKAIAAQWSASSYTWIEVGEVTGRNENAGTINGVKYDHIFPIEIDVPGGNVQTLQIGYNEGDNPFVTAQAFIDEHMLDQGYLAQIADYIRQRVGEGSVPTIGAETGAASAATPSASTPMDIEPSVSAPASYDHLPMCGYKSFENGADSATLNKMLTKIREFNVSVKNSLSSSEVNEGLDSLSSTLAATSRYHSSIISDGELGSVKRMVKEWTLLHAFPALDLARLLVIHPDASRSTRKQIWADIIDAAINQCNTLESSNVVGMPAIAIPMLSMRLFANCFRGGKGSSEAAISRIPEILRCAESFVSSKNKNIRLALSTVLLNISSYLYSVGSFQDESIPALYLSVVGGVVGNGAYETEALVRVLVGLGTILLVDDKCKEEAKALQFSSMVQRVDSGHGEKASAVVNEIQLILQ